MSQLIYDSRTAFENRDTIVNFVNEVDALRSRNR